jgi:cobalt/nickel transport system permease protein
MHMADALLSPAVAGVFWGISAASLAYGSRKIKQDADDSAIPLMGVLAAFVFAAQMINFTIPVTGSSGHIGGGLLLAILLGPYSAFLSIASVLIFQALFFADGGLLALGCNMFNLGWVPAFIVFPLVFKPLAGRNPKRGRLTLATLISAIIAMQIGSLGVVLQTFGSGISALPLRSFLLTMQPIHLAIGLVEGLITAVIVNLIYQHKPELIRLQQAPKAARGSGLRVLVIGLLLATFALGGLLSWYASDQPDGLEWSIAKVTGLEELEVADSTIATLATHVQQVTSFLPDYAANGLSERFGISLSGIIGAGLLLLFGLLLLRVMKRREE